MDIEKQFNLIAEEYDSNRRKFIPCFDDFYKKVTDFILSNIDDPKRIIDLGAGTGLLTYFWYQQCPNSEYVQSSGSQSFKLTFEEIQNIAGIPTDHFFLK